MTDRSIKASFLLSPLSKITNPESSIQFNLVKYSNSNRVNDLVINNTIPVTLYNSLLTLRDTGKEFELKGDILKKITNKNYNVDLAKFSDKKIMYDFAKEKDFDVNAQGNRFTRDRTLMNLLKSPGSMIFASGNSNTEFLTSDPDKICDR